MDEYPEHKQRTLLTILQMFVLPCRTSYLLKNLRYIDVSDNLLTDMTLSEMLCDGAGVLKDLRVLNISGNALKVLSQTCNMNEVITCVFDVVSKVEYRSHDKPVYYKSLTNTLFGFFLFPLVCEHCEPPSGETVQIDPSRHQ